MHKSTVRAPSQPFSGEGGEAADLQQLDPQSLDLHEDAVQGRLVFEWTFQDRVGALSSRLEGRKGAQERLAQVASDPYLVDRCHHVTWGGEKDKHKGPPRRAIMG